MSLSLHRCFRSALGGKVLHGLEFGSAFLLGSCFYFSLILIQ